MTTFACVTTGLGAAGIAVLEVFGPEAVSIAARLGARADEAPRVVVLREGPRALDEAVVRVVAPERSFTGALTVEICCHGGGAAVGRVLEAVVRAGAQACRREDLLAAAVRNGRIDEIQAEAYALLPEALTALAALTLNDQAQGALSRAIRDGVDRRRLLETAPLGLALAHPPRVVLAGRPNAGKSTLFNAMLDRERAVVFDQPGTTRDPVHDVAAIEGVPVRLVDTAGLGDPRDALDRAGMERAVRELRDAALALWVYDCTEPPYEPPPLDCPVVRVWNKIDLGGAPAPFSAVPVAAARRQGLDELRRAVLAALRIAPSYVPGRPVVFTRRQVQLLQS